jgi:hypothetical protein
MIAAAAILVAAFILPQEGASQGAQPNTGGVTRTTGELALGGSNYWAVVNGHLAIGASARVRGRGVVLARRLATGTYEVIFLDNIRSCAYTATVADFDAFATEPTGEITTVGRVTDVRGVFITTHSSAGAPSDRSFHLLVSC